MDMLEELTNELTGSKSLNVGNSSFSLSEQNAMSQDPQETQKLNECISKMFHFTRDSKAKVMWQ